MWKLLTSAENVYTGNKIRYADPQSPKAVETLFKVVKTDQHYFELLPAAQHADSSLRDIAKKIVKYFDLGYNINLEVWVD